MQQFTTIDTYHEYMVEAFSALRLGLGYLHDAEEYEHDDHHRYFMYSEAKMQCRFAFLLASNALEAAANALILSLETDNALYDDIEKVKTILKFEMFCMVKGVSLDRGNVLYARAKDIIRCRNEFVHPKPRNVLARLTSDESDIELVIKKTKARNYPEYFSMFEPRHSVQAIGDILSFLSWIIFDVCQYGIDEGALVLGFGQRISSSSVYFLAQEYGFDVRTFGEMHYECEVVTSVY